MTIEEQYLQAMLLKLEVLKGAYVHHIEVTDGGGFMIPVIVLHHPKQKKDYAMVVTSDAEGNGPGHIELFDLQAEEAQEVADA